MIDMERRSRNTLIIISSNIIINVVMIVVSLIYGAQFNASSFLIVL